MGLTPSPTPKTDIRIRQAIRKLASSKGGPNSIPEFATVLLNTLTANRLIATDANKQLESILNLADWIAGTTNQITITNDGDGSITVSIPDPLVPPGDLTMGAGKVINASAGKVRVEDKDTSEPIGESDGYVGVAIIGGTPRIYFAVNGTMYYIDGTAAAVPGVGEPMGICPLAITYPS